MGGVPGLARHRRRQQPGVVRGVRAAPVKVRAVSADLLSLNVALTVCLFTFTSPGISGASGVARIAFPHEELAHISCGAGPTGRSLFRRLDPVLWKESGYNPVLMLGAYRKTHWKRPARITVCGTVSQRLRGVRRRTRKISGSRRGKLIAYFSAEYGLTECLPVYSGGLGILSGDHLKSSSDQDYPLIASGCSIKKDISANC